jgi:hypothetical protein
MNRVSGDDDSNSAPRKESGKGKNDEVIDREVRDQIKSGRKAFSYGDIARLRERYKDPKLVDTIMDAFADKMDSIRDHARELARKVIEKYGNGGVPTHRILEYIAAYRNKTKMDDTTYAEVIRLVRKGMSGINIEDVTVRTNLGKALGYAPSDVPEGLSIDDKDKKHLDDILRRYEETKSLWFSVINQTITYRDCSPEAITGKYDREKHAMSHYIHPLFAAFYLPKIDIIDHQTLLANIGEIVKARHERKALRSLPNYTLFNNMVNDPSDMACSDESPMADLRKRFDVQTKIWAVVMALRNGLYYTADAGKALVALESCQIPGLDMPELGYIQDEGALLRRFLNVFSMRPTLVNVYSPQPSIMSSSPYDRMLPVTRNAQVPMLMLRLSEYTLPGQPIDISQALTSSTLIHDGNTLTTRTQQVTSSYEFLCIYVTRRHHKVITSQYSQAFQFNSLPISTSGVESLNEREVNAVDVLTLPDGMTFQLRSAVAVERAIMPAGGQIICGTSAVIKMNDASGTCLYYAPGASRFKTQMPTLAGGITFDHTPPITAIDYHLPLNAGPDDESFHNIVCKRATILVYVRQ